MFRYANRTALRSWRIFGRPSWILSRGAGTGVYATQSSLFFRINEQRSWICSTAVLFQDKQRSQSGRSDNRNKKKAIAINTKLVELGKKQQWEAVET